MPGVVVLTTVPKKTILKLDLQLEQGLGRFIAAECRILAYFVKVH